MEFAEKLNPHEFAEKLKFEIERKFDHENDWKTKIKKKLNLIYNSKCKSNAKWWNIRMKARNITQSRLEMIQLIAGFMAFHSTISKTKICVRDVISLDSFDQILISCTLRTQKWVRKLKKSKDSQIVLSRQFDLIENPRMVFRREEHSNL